MALKSDITRCYGETHYGQTCPRRLECERYLAIEADGRWEAQSGRNPFHSYAKILCHGVNLAFFIPVSRTNENAS